MTVIAFEREKRIKEAKKMALNEYRQWKLKMQEENK